MFYFYMSAFKRVINHLNDIQVKWAVRKYRRFKRSRFKARMVKALGGTCTGIAVPRDAGSIAIGRMTRAV